MGSRVLGRILDASVRESRGVLGEHFRRPLSAGATIARDDPLDPDLLTDTRSWWRTLHAGGPVHYHPGQRLWLISGFEEVRAALAAHDRLSSADGVIRVRTRLPMLISIDRPDHKRLRRLLAREFTQANLSALEPRIEELAVQGIESMLASPSAEVRSQLAGPLPVAVIADLLGIPADDRPDFRRWSDRIVEASATGVGSTTLRSTLRSAGSTISMLAYFERLVRERRRRPGRDLLGILAASEQDGGLSDAELFWFAVLLLIAGNETTMNLISGIFCAFATWPEQFDRLTADPSLVGAAVEEGLRWSSPVQAFFRTARTPYPVGSVTIPQGSRVMVCFGAANHDPAVFERPDEFDLGRRADNHIAFGGGIHFCLGAHLARREAAVVLTALRERVGSIEPAGAVEWQPDPTLRTIKRLPVRLHPRPGDAG